MEMQNLETSSEMQTRKKGTKVCRLWKTNLILLKEPEESRTRTEQNATLADLKKKKKRATC
jgi:hypothetical protein